MAAARAHRPALAGILAARIGTAIVLKNITHRLWAAALAAESGSRNECNLALRDEPLGRSLLWDPDAAECAEHGVRAARAPVRDAAGACYFALLARQRAAWPRNGVDDGRDHAAGIIRRRLRRDLEDLSAGAGGLLRSEERRVGKECRSRW